MNYSINVSDVCLELEKISDLRNAIHSIVRFDSEKNKSLEDIEKYYSYTMNLF